MARTRDLSKRLEMTTKQKQGRKRYPHKDSMDYTIQLPLALYVGLVRLGQQRYCSMASVIKVALQELILRDCTLEGLMDTAIRSLSLSEEDCDKVREQWSNARQVPISNAEKTESVYNLGGLDAPTI